MRTAVIVSIVLAFLGVGIYSLNNKDDTKSSESPTLTKTQFDTIQEEIAIKKATLYDVRTSEEFSTGKFAGAVNLPLQEIEKGNFPDASKESRIYIYCRSGNRSAQALELLKTAGFRDVVNLGGLADVEKIGGKLQ